MDIAVAALESTLQTYFRQCFLQSLRPSGILFAKAFRSFSNSTTVMY